MGITVKILDSSEASQWDAYVQGCSHGTLYHLSKWRDVVHKTYGHESYYLIAVENGQVHSGNLNNHMGASEPLEENQHSDRIVGDKAATSSGVVGVLPLIHIRHPLFGNNLISIPFFDLGGVLADDEKAEKALLSEAITLAQRLKAERIELRHVSPLSVLGQGSHELWSVPPQLATVTPFTRSHKVRMILELPESGEILMRSFRSKLRSQIHKPMKEGLKAKIGRGELLDDFYTVFCENMRDLGSPVHSKKMMANVLDAFNDSRIVVVYQNGCPLACSLVVGLNQTLENPWASAIRRYSRLSPNMLLYWTMLEFACNNGYRYFDFGRSTPGEGTYRFKEQWGAEPTPLHWQYVFFDGTASLDDSNGTMFQKAIQLWQKLPIPVSKIIGPAIRKYIGL